jgi:hypothetical protein
MFKVDSGFNIFSSNGIGAAGIEPGIGALGMPLAFVEEG